MEICAVEQTSIFGVGRKRAYVRRSPTKRLKEPQESHMSALLAITHLHPLAIAVAILTPTLAVGGYLYGSLTGRMIDWILAVFTVLSAALALALIAPWQAIVFVSLVTILATGGGTISRHGVAPNFDTRLTGAAFAAVTLFDLAFWGARFFGG
jgi:hypothetical protein